MCAASSPSYDACRRTGADWVPFAFPAGLRTISVLHNFVKPPIHGWAFGQLRRWLPAPPSRAELAATYDRLRRWTDFWPTARRAPDAELPHYQHGNDSGWDNATTFDPERVVVTADLAAFLVLQLRQLGELADESGRQEESRRWTRTAGDLQTALLDQLWDTDRCLARAEPTWTRTMPSRTSAVGGIVHMSLRPEPHGGRRATPGCRCAGRRTRLGPGWRPGAARSR